MPITINIDMDSAIVNNALRQLVENVDDMQPTMTDIGEHIASMIDLNFRDLQDPYRTPWLPLKKPRKDGSSKPLNDTGALKASITSNPTPHDVTIGTNLIYGATHQFGRDAIPARPFFPTEEHGMPNDWEQDILDIIRSHLESTS